MANRVNRFRFRSLAELQMAVASGVLSGKAWHMIVLHDDACTPSVCRCQPEFIVEPLTTDAYLEGQRKQDAWVRQTAS